MRPYVGIDVSRAELVVAVRPSQQTARYANSAAGHQQLISRVQAVAPLRIVVEGTGGYERQVVMSLQEAGLPVVVVNPRQVRDFAKGIGKLAKTDPIDAGVLAHYAQVVESAEPVRLSANERALQDLVGRRRQLRDMRTAELNRRDHLSEWTRPSWERMMVFLQEELVTIEAEIAAVMRHDALLHQKATQLQTVPGIGPIVSATVLGRLPEIGRVSNKAITALSGLAPYTIHSGTARERAMIRGGRSDVRSALYMATMTAKRWNPVIRDFYDHLLAAHKPHKVVMIACARKLLVILNAMVRDGTSWNAEVAN